MPVMKYPRNRLHTLRIDRGLKSWYVAQQIGIAYGTLGDYERFGTKVPGIAISALAGFYGVGKDVIKEAISMEAISNAAE